MDERRVEEAMDQESTVEPEQMSSSGNPVLTLITTEDGIPTSTEVTVLTTTLGNMPIMTASLATLAEVPLVTSHPTFVTSHHGVSTVYATSITPAVGQSVVVGEGHGHITVLDANGSQQTIVVHADQLATLAEVHDGTAPVTQAQLLNMGYTIQTSPEIVEEQSRIIEIEDNQPQVTEELAEVSLQEQKTSEVSVVVRNETAIRAPVIENTGDFPKSPTLRSVSAEPEARMESCIVEPTISAEKSANEQESIVVEESIHEKAKDDNDEPKLPDAASIIPSNPIPDKVVCLVCYQAFFNPKRKEIESTTVTEKDRDVDGEQCESVDDSAEVKTDRHYGRTLAKFFEISRINMSIVTRRSYKDYEVPICHTCNSKLVEAENILDELRRLERELYFIRQRVKDEIITSHDKNQENNRELAEARKNIDGLAEILEVVDRIRHDIINDGRPPKVPRSVGDTSRSSRKRAKTTVSIADHKETKGDGSLEANVSETIQNLKNEEASSTSLEEKGKVHEEEANDKRGDVDAEGKGVNEDESTKKKEELAVRTSFGRLIKRPTYMVNQLISENELSDLDDSSEDNYEEIEVKPELPQVDVGDNGDEELDEEDPAWSPGKGMFISDRVGIPPSSSDESNYSGEDSDAETSSKLKVKKEPRDRKARKQRQRTKRKSSKRVPVVKQEDINYEVKVIQLDGTELMTINASGANDKIGLQPDITQKVMDSQAVIMVKNQLFGKRVQCPHCTRTFTDPQRRDIHVKKKHEGDTKPFQCEVCQKRFTRQDHQKNHMKRHLRPPRQKIYKPKAHNTEKNQPCEYCDQRFRNKSELAVHIRTHTGEKPYKCEHCTESFVSVLKREFHIELIHAEIPPLRCEYCPRGFFRQHRLKLHCVSHTGEKANICELCGKSFSQAAMLRYHQTTHSELNLKQFKCQQCNKIFANPQNLKSHMESQHQKMYRHRCTHCDKGYTQMSHLRRHLRTHTGDQPYGCSHCPKRFTSGAALKIHVRIHTGERPYYCQLCEKGFRSKTKLGRHLKTLIHTGEKEKVKKEENDGEASTDWTEIVGIIAGV